jgi:hypothetical protein
LAIIIEQDLADRLRASECLPVRIGPRQPGGNIETVLRRLRPELARLPHRSQIHRSSPPPSHSTSPRSKWKSGLAWSSSGSPPR